MGKPTEEQVKAEIEALKAVRNKVPAKNFFGDSNVDSIDAQIKVLEKHMTPDAAHDAFKVAGEYVESSASEAAEWLKSGEAEGYPSPAGDWQELADLAG